ncbi:S8 family serine peptidase [Clostridium sp. DL1XJH146]
MFSFKKKLDQELYNALNDGFSDKLRVIIHYKTNGEKIKKNLSHNSVSFFRLIDSVNCISTIVNKSLLQKLSEYPDIDYIALDTFAFLCGKNVLSSNRIHLNKNYKLTGKGVCIGIIDSGVFPHYDLKSPTNKINGFYDIVNNLKYPYDDNGHGTFISGIICSSGYSSKGFYKGIAENSNIYMVKAFNQLGRGYCSDILLAIQHILEVSEKHNIRILCLPFEITNYNKFILSLFQKLFNKMISKNMIVVVPSGNSGNGEISVNTLKGISALKEVITVGGLDTTGEIKGYKFTSPSSTKSDKPDFSAACVDICSLNSDTTYISERNGRKLYPRPLEEMYTSYTGTSIAAAFGAGIVSLLLENNENLNHSDILALIKLSCELLNIPKEIQGSGKINFEKLMP